MNCENKWRLVVFSKTYQHFVIYNKKVSFTTEIRVVAGPENRTCISQMQVQADNIAPSHLVSLKTMYLFKQCVSRFKIAKIFLFGIRKKRGGGNNWSHCHTQKFKSYIQCPGKTALVKF